MVIVTICMAPLTSTLEKDECRNLIEDSIKSIRILWQNAEDESKRKIAKKIFHRNIVWKSMEVEVTDNLWENNLLELMQEFLLYHSIQHNTRRRRLDGQSLIDLVFTRQKDDALFISLQLDRVIMHC